MSVDTTIPDSSNNVGDDLSAIRENFELLASAQVVDEGSTADGDYIRYENGWQIVIKSITDFDLGDDTIQIFGIPVNFIDDFVAASISTDSLGTPDRNIFPYISFRCKDDSFDFYIEDGEALEDSTLAQEIIAIGIGRWK